MVVVLLVGHRTGDLRAVGSSPASAPLCSGLGQATYICVPLSPLSIIWYGPRAVMPAAGKVTAGLAENNGSLLLGYDSVTYSADCQETGTSSKHYA